MYAAVLFVHLLGATIWTGGHLILALAILPGVLRSGSTADLLRFEKSFEPVGMWALGTQVTSGLWMAWMTLPDLDQWIALDSSPARAIAMKLLLLTATALVALHARFRVLPKLSRESLPTMAWHIGLVTLFSVAFVATGLSFRYGGLA